MAVKKVLNKFGKLAANPVTSVITGGLGGYAAGKAAERTEKLGIETDLEQLRQQGLSTKVAASGEQREAAKQALREMLFGEHVATGAYRTNSELMRQQMTDPGRVDVLRNRANYQTDPLAGHDIVPDRAKWDKLQKKGFFEKLAGILG